jgi:hypothetical protein
LGPKIWASEMAELWKIPWDISEGADFPLPIRNSAIHVSSLSRRVVVLCFACFARLSSLHVHYYILPGRADTAYGLLYASFLNYMSNPDSHSLPIYPAYAFKASRTYFSWVKITAVDLHALRTQSGFEGSLLLAQGFY